jgi:hypothetical protein
LTKKGTGEGDRIIEIEKCDDPECLDVNYDGLC